PAQPCLVPSKSRDDWARAGAWQPSFLILPSAICRKTFSTSTNSTSSERASRVIFSPRRHGDHGVLYFLASLCPLCLRGEFSRFLCPRKTQLVLLLAPSMSVTIPTRPPEPSPLPYLPPPRTLRKS